MAIKETVRIDVTTNADNAADDLTTAIKELQVAIDKMSGSLDSGFNDANKTIEKVNTGVEDIGDSAKKSEKGVGKLSKAFGNIGKASGILFLVQKGLEIMRDLFNENQFVVDAFNTAFEFLSIVFNDFVDFILSNASNVTGFFKSIFDDPLSSIKKLGTAITDNIVERFQSAFEVLGFLSSALFKFVTGDFKGAMTEFSNAGTELYDVVTGVDDSQKKITEGAKNLVSATANYVKETGKAAAETVKLNKQAELSDSIRQGLIEKYDLEAEKLRQVRDDERQTIDDRIKANEDLGAVLDKQEAEMMAAAQLRLVAAAREAEKKKGNLEAEKALAEARNEVAGVEAQVAGLRSEQLSNEASLQRELLELTRGKKEAENESAELSKQSAIDAELDIIKKIDLEKKLSNFKKEAQLELIADELANTKNGTLRYQELLNERLLIESEYAAESKRIDQELEQAKVDRRRETNAAINQVLMQGFDAAAALAEAFAGESEDQQRRAFQVQKALSAASTVMSTIEGAQSAFTTANKSPITAVFPAYPYIQAGLATAFGIAKLQQIRSQQFEPNGTPTPPSASSAAPSAATASSFSPNVNVVGSSGINVIADSLNRRPVKAYVVGGDVSSQQELDRKRVKNATV